MSFLASLPPTCRRAPRALGRVGQHIRASRWNSPHSPRSRCSEGTTTSGVCLKDLEALAQAFEGVDKAYAIQAGRELRVIVEADKIDDKKSEELSFAISQKIEKEMTYPGQVKVTVIREKRSVSVAR